MYRSVVFADGEFLTSSCHEV